MRLGEGPLAALRRRIGSLRAQGGDLGLYLDGGFFQAPHFLRGGFDGFFAFDEQLFESEELLAERLEIFAGGVRGALVIECLPALFDGAEGLAQLGVFVAGLFELGLEFAGVVGGAALGACGVEVAPQRGRGLFVFADTVLECGDFVTQFLLDFPGLFL